MGGWWVFCCRGLPVELLDLASRRDAYRRSVAFDRVLISPKVVSGEAQPAGVLYICTRFTLMHLSAVGWLYSKADYVTMLKKKVDMPSSVIVSVAVCEPGSRLRERHVIAGDQQ